MRRFALLIATAALAGCSGPPGVQHASSDLNPSGRPKPDVNLYQPQLPPNSTNAFDPLYCHSEGPGTVCSRS